MSLESWAKILVSREHSILSFPTMDKIPGFSDITEQTRAAGKLKMGKAKFTLQKSVKMTMPEPFMLLNILSER